MTGFHDEFTHAHVTAAALEQGKGLDLWSLALVILALGVLLWRPDARTPWQFACLLACVLAGMAQKVFAARVAFDATLFRKWAEPAQSSDTHGRTEALSAVDHALAACGLRKDDAGEGRGMVDRSRGALRLLRWQATCLFVQFATTLAALVR